jgi:hypothetical protein
MFTFASSFFSSFSFDAFLAGFAITAGGTDAVEVGAASFGAEETGLAEAAGLPTFF